MSTNLPPKPILTEDLPFIGVATVQNREHETFPRFLEACRNNESAVALQLANDQEPAVLTWGLSHSIKAQHLDMARQLLLNGVSWDYHTLSYASRDLDAIKLLVDFGFNVNSTLLGGGNLLRIAVARNDEEAIHFLLKQGANPNFGPPRYPHGHISQIRSLPNSGMTLNAAAGNCTPEIFALLLEHGAVLSNSIALHRAAGVSVSVPPGERIPMLRYLLGLGLDINGMDDAIKIGDDGRGQRGSPLMYAIYWGRTIEAKWLLEHGADPDRKTPWGISARDQVRRYPAEHRMSVLLQEICPEEP
ncbi:ankyrin [Amniculicola lignicola CBS 123094]|uniref:Ankyrin n=1 Tax=Amniculicola lignicola CBS 123094 TaxID=1392246 RepID=A0A6A5WD55_9PLEO|nr:ankyrin [Amniculicola lignicola CBS 123094]